MSLGPIRLAACFGLIAVPAFVMFTRKGRDIFLRFFREETHPINLALFRIALFATSIGLIFCYPPVWFSALPSALRFAPYGFEWLDPYFPINPAVALPVLIVYIFFCVTGILGLFTRFSAWAVFFSGVYLFAITNWYGKITHFHHVFWFAALLAVSDAGDFFSLDAVLKAFRRADSGITEPPGPSQKYALPLGFTLILIGILYFFPGIWKVITQGTEWFTTENLKFHMYEKWLGLGGWLPFFRIDRHPILYRLSGLATVLFEISFIVLIFFKPLRPVLFWAGLFFHNMTNSIMRISFWYLQTLYVILLDWDLIFEWCGRKFFPEMMYVIYDGNCKLCRRTIAAVRVFDVFGRVKYVNALDEETIKKNGLSWLDSKALLHDMHAVIGKRIWKGYDAYQTLAWRVPVFWLLIPFLYAGPVISLGNKIYRKVADSRTCQIAGEPSVFPELKSSGTNNWPVVLMGTFLIAINCYYGIFKIHSWPFSIYPTFDGFPKSEIDSILVVPINEKGETIPLDDRLYKKRLYHSRVSVMYKRILAEKDSPKFHDRLIGIWQVLATFNPQIKDAATVQIYQTCLSLLPERAKDNPLSRQFLFEFHPSK